MDVGGLLIKARTANQRKMVEAVETNDLVFAMGPAGTGKTYTAVALAVRALKKQGGSPRCLDPSSRGSGRKV